MSRATCRVWPARRWKRAIAPCLSRAWVFAGRFAARYGRVWAAIRRPELLLALRPSHAITLVHRHGDRISISHALLNRFLVRVDVYDRAKEPAYLRRNGDGQAALIGTRKEHAGARMMPSTRAARNAVAGEALVPRLMARRHHLESVGFGPEPDAGQGLRPRTPIVAKSDRDARRPDSIDLPLVRQRVPVVAGNSLTHGEQVVDASRGEARSSPRGVTARAMPSLADHELERLADRVIGSLDRRIVAQRERMGRT